MAQNPLLSAITKAFTGGGGRSNMSHNGGPSTDDMEIISEEDIEKATGETSAKGQGSSTVGGYVEEVEREAALAGSRKYRTYSDVLANTTIVATATRYFLNILTKASWKVEPAKDKDGVILEGAQEYADKFNDMMNDMETPWYRVVRRGAMYRYYGFGIQEWTLKRRPDGLLGLRAIDARPQSTITRWEMGPNGEVLGCYQQTNGAKEVFLERGRLVHIVDDALNDSPEGLGLFRHVVRAAQRLRAFEELEEVGFETDLRGIPIGRAPLKALRKDQDAGNLTEADKNARLNPMRRFIQGHIRNKKTGFLMDSSTYASADDANRPSGVPEWDVSLLQGTSSSQEAIASAISRVSWEMARVLGVEHLMLGSDGAGSLALGKVKTSDFYMTIQATLLEMVTCYQRDVVNPVSDLNGWDPKLRPKLVTDTVQFRDIAEMAAALRDLAVAGAPMQPDDPAVAEMRSLIGLSPVPEAIVDRTLDQALMELQNPTGGGGLSQAEPGKPDKGAHKGPKVAGKGKTQQ